MSNKLKGYTLIELLIFMGIISILLVVLTDVFGAILDVRRESASFTSVEQDGNYILNRLMYDIARATSINQPNAVGTVGNTLDVDIDGLNYVYSINNGNLQLSVNSEIFQLNSINTTISGLNFKRIGNDDGQDTIQFNYSVTSKIQRQGSGYEVKNYQSTVGLR